MIRCCGVIRVVVVVVVGAEVPETGRLVNPGPRHTSGEDHGQESRLVISANFETAGSVSRNLVISQLHSAIGGSVDFREPHRCETTEVTGWRNDIPKEGGRIGRLVVFLQLSHHGSR